MSDFSRLAGQVAALLAAGRLDAAEASCARLVAAHGDEAEALHLAGIVAYRRRRYDEAIALIGRALQKTPDSATFHANLGNVQKDAGDAHAAAASYRRALALDPSLAAARNNLGVLLLEAGDARGAMAAFADVVARRPDHFRAHANLGKARIAAGELVPAEAALRRALALAPDFVDALGDLGLLLQRQGRRDEAIALFRRRVAAEPRAAPAHADLALALHQAGELAEAAQAYARAAMLAPQPLEVACNRIALLQKTCDWEALAAETPRVMQALRDGVAGVPVGLTVSLPGVTPRMQLAAASNNAAPLEGRAPLAAARTFGRAQRLRIGYLSGDFRAHATARLASEVFELHDRARHAVVLLSYGPDDGSAERARLAAGADAFVDVAGLDDRAAARRIADLGINVLVDLNGATDNGRMGIAAWRPAPIQVSWLGFPGTLGASFYDYVIGDRYVIPVGAEGDYAETVVRLPDCYQCNDRRRARPAATSTRAACGLPADAVVLGCFNQSYKITPDVFAAWLRVLAAVPATVLWLYDDNPLAAASLRGRTAAAGVDPGRLAFAPHAPPAEHLARYALVDLAVDTFPCTSHTTGSDALWMGCPLVTVTGATFAARVATSLVVNAGLPELAAGSLAEYEALVTALAADAPRRADLRRRVAAARDGSPLFDTPRFVRHLEAAYARIAAAGPGAARGTVDAARKNVL